MAYMGQKRMPFLRRVEPIHGKSTVGGENNSYDGGAFVKSLWKRRLLGKECGVTLKVVKE